MASSQFTGLVKSVKHLLSRIEDTGDSVLQCGECTAVEVVQNASADLQHVELNLTEILAKLEDATPLDESEIALARQLAADSPVPDTQTAAEVPSERVNNLSGNTNEDADLFDDDSDMEDSMFENVDESQGSNCIQDDADIEVGDNEEVDQKYQDVLKNYFGYPKFKPMQWKIISSVLNDKRDNLVVMATGYGKSLCYQFASVYTNRVTIVISPLLSLMEDQVLSLMTSGIPACQLSSTQSDNGRLMMEVRQGKYRIVYMTPERVTTETDFLKSVDTAVGIDLIAIDEAHCVSQWGHDFRSAYRQLDVIKREMPGVPVLALTATATPVVRKDICKALKLSKPIITCTGFDRPNLYLSVTLKTPSLANDLRELMVKVGNSWQFEGSTVIYCPTRKSVENCQAVLSTMGVSCSLYHAGISYEQRRKAHKDFVNDKVSTIIATVAFGMGIDKPDVRRVIHYGAPKDIESYYQEIGRAGRDGLNSECITFYNHSDFNTSRYFLKDITNQTFLNHKLEMLRKMESYLGTASCRRREILAHFEDKKVIDNVGGTDSCCDNCRRQLARGGEVGVNAQSAGVDVGQDVLKILKAVEACNGRFGLGTVCGFIVGSKSSNFTTKYSFLTSKPGYGGGKEKSEAYWKALGRQLASLQFLCETPVPRGFGSTLSVGDKGRNWYNQNLKSPKLVIQPNNALAPFLKYTKTVSKSGDSYTHTVTIQAANKQSSSTILPKIKQKRFISTSSNIQGKSETSDGGPIVKNLFNKLIEYREKIREEADIELNSHMVATNKNLLDLAKLRPTTMEGLLKIDSLPKKRAELLGDRVLKLISDYCQENNLLSDEVETVQNPQTMFIQSLSESEGKLLWSMKDSPRTSYLKFQGEGKSLSETASHRGLGVSTLTGHLCDALVLGLPLDVERIGLTAATQKLVEEAIRAPPINSDISRLSPIKENLPEYVTYDQIKLSLAILKYEYGVDVNTNSMMSPMPSTSSQPKRPPASHPQADSKRSLPIWMSANGPRGSKPSQPAAKKKKSIF